MSERSYVDESAQQELEDDVAADGEVQLVLGVLRPVVEPAFLPRDEQPDADGHQHDCLRDALDDDDLDKSVVLAAEAAQLVPQPGEVVTSLQVGLRQRARP